MLVLIGDCPEGIVAVAGNTLRILSLDKLGDAFNAEAVPLRYTPRKVAVHSVSGNLVIVEADHNAYNEEEKGQIYEATGVRRRCRRTRPYRTRRRRRA